MLHPAAIFVGAPSGRHVAMMAPSPVHVHVRIPLFYVKSGVFGLSAVQRWDDLLKRTLV